MVQKLRLAMIVASLVVLAGCTDSQPSTRQSATVKATPYPAPSLGPLGKPGCEPASPISDTMELQGTPAERGTSLYGLAFVTTGDPFPIGDDIKVVWRMTGKGDLAVRLIDPHGRPKALAWGPEPHGESTFHRPGDEWGTGFKLDQPGCWQIQFSRDKSHASVWIDAAS